MYGKIKHVEINHGKGWPPPPELSRGGPWRHSERSYLAIKKQLRKNKFDLDSANRILDFGCETGRILQHFDFKNKEVWGIDKNHKAIKWCRENLSHDLNFIHSQSHPHLPFPDGYFDFILAFSVFTHSEADYLFWLMELRRILSKTGVFYFTILDEHTIEKGKRGEKLPPSIVKSLKVLEEPLKEDFIIVSHSCSFFKRDRFLKEISKYFNVLDCIERGYNVQTSIIVSQKDS